MWCPACGAPLPATGPSCVACGRERGVAGSPAGPPTPWTGPPCEAGRSLAGLRIHDLRLRERIAGTTPGRLETRGEQDVYEVRGPRDLHVWIAHVEWADGEREVRRTRRAATPWWQDHLLGYQRLAVEAGGDGFLQVELGLARLDGTGMPRVVAADEFELDARAQTCVRCALLDAGATGMGTRQELLGIADERRHVLCVTYRPEARRVPVVAFALTRIAPLLGQHHARSA